AGRGDRAERRDDRLTGLAQASNRLMDFLRGANDPARTVDADDDRANERIVAMASELADQIVDVQDDALDVDDGDLWSERGPDTFPAARRRERREEQPQHGEIDARRERQHSQRAASAPSPR